MTEPQKKDVFSEAFLNSAAGDPMIEFISRMKTDAARLSSWMENAKIETADIVGQKLAISLSLRQSDSHDWQIRQTYTVTSDVSWLYIFGDMGLVEKHPNVEDTMKAMARLIKEAMPATYVHAALAKSEQETPALKQ